MLVRFCQLKSRYFVAFLLLIVGGCSWQKYKSTGADLVSAFPVKWFKVNPEHSLQEKGNPVSHLLFDSTPEFRESEQTVNAIIATPTSSQNAYKIDLNSGQLHFSHAYCKQKDVWNKYSGSINRPSFSIGYVPRVLDQLGEPQKIIIFSSRPQYGTDNSLHSFKVKMVGAYVEQICPEGNCLGKSNWLSRMVFVGVDAQDTSFPEIATITDFKNTVNWEAASAQLENIDGRNFIGTQTYPYLRVGQLIEFKEAFDYFKKRSIFLSDKEIKKIQKGCYTLYEGLWDEVGKWRPEDMPTKTKEELNAKLKIREQLKEQRKPVGFLARLKKFTKKYYQEISTCERFVYHGNINRNPEKFWFLSYMGMYYRLHREGYYFNCQQRTWQRNVLDHGGKPTHDLTQDIDRCFERDIDQAMEYIPNFLAGLKDQTEYYRFIEYDNHPFGSHSKIYAWIKVRNTKFDCSNDPNEKIKKETRVFPEEVTWQPRVVKDLATDLKLIY